MICRLHRDILVALLVVGSAILLFSCKSKTTTADVQLDAIKTEESRDLTIVMSENGRKSYLFQTPLLEGYTLGRDPYREFRKGISITTYQDDSLTTVNAVLVANYAIYYENRKLWEAKGDVVITKHDGTRLYTQQLFWNSMTKKIYSNVDTKLVSNNDEVVGEGFESDEEMNEPRFRRWKGKMEVDTEQMKNNSSSEQKSTKKSVAPQSQTKPSKSGDMAKPKRSAQPSARRNNSSAKKHPQHRAPKSAHVAPAQNGGPRNIPSPGLKSFEKVDRKPASIEHAKLKPEK